MAVPRHYHTLNGLLSLQNKHTLYFWIKDPSFEWLPFRRDDACTERAGISLLHGWVTGPPRRKFLIPPTTNKLLTYLNLTVGLQDVDHEDRRRRCWHAKGRRMAGACWFHFTVYSQYLHWVSVSSSDVRPNIHSAIQERSVEVVSMPALKVGNNMRLLKFWKDK